MKNIIRLFCVSSVCFALICEASAQGFVDSFSGTSVNSSLWNVVLPEADSSVTEANGYVSLENAGRLVTQSPLPTAYDVTGNFLMTANPFSNFKVMLRTDGVSNPNYPHTTVDGIEVQFNVEDDNGVLSNNIKIYNQTGSAGVELGVVSANLLLNNWNTFSITDDGNNIAVYFDGATTPNLEVQSSYSAGNDLALLTREGGDAGSSISANGITEINNFQITATPEPSSLALFGLGLCGLVGMRKKLNNF